MGRFIKFLFILNCTLNYLFCNATLFSFRVLFVLLKEFLPPSAAHVSIGSRQSNGSILGVWGAAA